MNLPIVINKYRLYVDMVLILVGSIVMAISYPMFLIPLKIVPGGVSGISIILHHLFGLPVGITTFILNIPLLIMGWLLLGRTFAFRTIVGMTLSNFFIDFFTYVVKIPPITDDLLLGSMFGGVVLGIGLGITFLGNASTGGSDVIGQVVRKYTNYSAGMGIMGIDFLIISIAGFAFKSFEACLYGYLALFISSMIIDRVMEGSGYARGVFIVTEKKDMVKEFIFLYINRGVTEFKGRTGFQQKDTDIIFSAMNRKQVPMLKRHVKKIDPDAFIVVTEVYEIIGHGFTPRNVMDSSQT